MTNFANNYATRLSAYLLDDALTCTVDSVVGDPAVPYNAIIQRKNSFPDEIVTVTNVTGTTLTITRASEAVAGVQTAYDHPVGAVLRHIVTADGLADLAADAGTGWYDVSKYATVGAAVTAYNATGGTLYFPAGTYATAGGYTLSANGTVRGEGSGGLSDAAASFVSRITSTSPTASLFTVTADVMRFEGLSLHSDAASTPSAGAAVTVNGTTEYQRCDFEGVVVSGGFYIGIDVRNGSHWTMHGCTVYSPQLYCLKIANATNQDEGDFSISDCWFQAAGTASSVAAAVRIEGAGGGKIVNTRINGFSSTFVHGIDLYVLDATQTGELFLTQVSIAGFSGNGVNAAYEGNAGAWTKIIMAGCFIGTYNTTTTSRAVAITGQTYGVGPNFKHIVIAGCMFTASAGSRAAILLTNCSEAQIGVNYTDGVYFNPMVETAGFCENIADASGSISDGVRVSGTPALGYVPVALTGLTAEWAYPAWAARATYSDMVRRMPDLAGYWRLGESSGVTATDLGPHGIDGTYVNAPTLGTASLLTGDADTAVALLGSSTQYVTLGDAPVELDFAGDFSIVVWIKKAAATGGRVFAKRSTTLYGYELVINDTLGSVDLLVADGVDYRQATITAGSVCDDVRHCLVAVRRGVNLVGYVDGAFGATADAGLVGDMSGGGAHAAIGYLPDFGAGPLTATVDEVSVYGRALNLSEIDMLWRVGSDT